MAAGEKRWFASDNNASVHPLILEALAVANSGHAVGYGDDPVTAAAEQQLGALFGQNSVVRFVLNGTGANVYALGCFAGQGDAVLCSNCAHILVDETGAPTAVTGAQLLPLPTVDGKVSPAGVRHLVADYSDMHKPRPVILSLSQPTELGTLYSLDELDALCAVAHELGLLVHIDGARLSNAAAALGCSLQEAAGAKADVVCVGGTKNGLMFGEAVVFTPRSANRLPDTARLRKARLQLASKMRFIATQFSAWLKDDLWLKNATQANAMAKQLAEAVGQLGISFCYPVQTNAVFVKIPVQAAEQLRTSHFFYDWEGGAVRWMTSWDTQPADIDDFIRVLRASLAASGFAVTESTADGSSRSDGHLAAEGLAAFPDENTRQLLQQGRSFLRSDWEKLSLHPSPQQRGLIMPAPVHIRSAEAVRIDLPDAKAGSLGDASFTEITRERRSVRKFKPGGLSLEELTYLLWACAGSRRPPFRTVPSGGCRHPLDVVLYVREVEGLQPGLYRYDSPNHQLLLERAVAPAAGQSEENFRLELDKDFDAALLGQLWNSPVVFVWTALPYRSEWRYTVAAAKLVLLDAGHSCQALYGACTALKLGCCAVGAYSQEKLDALLGVDGKEELAVYAAPVGRA
ncbi:MAG: SagB family peptide dehydrogenase [Spirochaetes bacterium]|nr:SagB family peptide dehydrogenase [Spirochaetota bacterium]